MPTGYCTIDDVRRALREKDLPGDAAQDSTIVVDAITGQTEWLRSTTGTHFYVAGGIGEDNDDLVPTAARSHGPESLDIPSTPHPQHSTMRSASRDRYPHRTHGPYCRLPLGKRDVDSLQTLEVRDPGGGWTDWVADSSKTAGDDYELFVDPGGTPSQSYVHVRAASLPPLQHFDGAVRATYDYGTSELPRTVRRAVGMQAAAQLLTDDEAALGIPDSGQMVNAESKVQTMERQAEELLEAYL